MNKTKKIVIIITIFIIIYTAVGFIAPLAISTEAKSSRATYSNLDENKYPGYNSLIRNLKSQHPNWNFTILYTGIDWNQAVKSENSGHGGSPLNLISGNKTGEWLCSICGTKRYDNGSWCCASEKTIAYFMDSRNLLNNTDIFQLEEVKFNKNIHTLEGVKKMTSGTFLAGDSIGQAILTACTNANVSPYYVVSRILQEQGKSGSTTGKGMESDGQKYYNVFNVGASGNSKDQIIANALAKAKEMGWNTLEKSILGGIDFLKTKYINRGQNTLYLNKFDVDDSDGTLYTHQYMQNIQAAQSEAVKVYNIYNQTGKLNESYNFIIPVFENMPKEISPKPSDSETNPINVIVATQKDPLIVREGPGTGYKEIRRIEKGTVVLSIERQVNGNGWDKVILSDGVMGYVYSQYLQITDDVTNCNETMVVTQRANVRNGPGTTGTTIITTLNIGQAVTRIDTNRYERDGYKWDRVILSDGRQGFIVTDYLEKQTNTNTVTVIANDGLRLRSGPGTSYSKIRVLPYGLVVTRLEKAQAPGEGGHYWDKIITPDGVEGYAARQYLQENNAGGGTGPTTPSSSAQNNYKLDESKKQVIMEPKTTVKHLKDKGEKLTKATDKNGTELKDSDLIGTGAKLTINGKEYIAVKLGDVNGDGVINTGDTFLIKQVIVEVKKLDGVYKDAADVNRDGSINTGDSFIIKKEVQEIVSIKL